MKLIQSACLFCLTFILFAVSGCGADNSPDGLVDQQVKEMNQLADAMEAEKPAAEIDKIKARIDSVAKKIEALKLTPEEQEKLIERHKDDLDKAGKRLMGKLDALTSDMKKKMEEAMEKFRDK